MDQGLVKIALAVIALVAGATIVLKVIIKKKQVITKTTQKNNIVGGDQASRDINKK